MPSITCAAPAKLNLYLEILGRRPDGFHELETIFQTLDLHDEVTVTTSPGSGISMTCDDPSLPSDHRNLAWRAAEAFVSTMKGTDNSPLLATTAIAIRLKKRIPHGAGLGGGSSDAAAVIRCLHRIFPGFHDVEQRAQIAAQLGSDVPFFLGGGTALGHGRGERLYPLADLPRLPVTVFMPDASVSTPAAFSALTPDERGPRHAHDAAWWTQRLQSSGLGELLHNRLTGPAIRLCPDVERLLEWLRHQSAPFLMSGSGAACFVLDHRDAPAGVRSWKTWFRPRTHLDQISDGM